MEAYEYLAQVYDKLMYDVDYSNWALYVAGFLKKINAKNVFEAACGTGKIALELYRLGFDITASDISPQMLKAASDSARKNGYDIRFILQDMRRIEVGKKADAVISSCDGPNYLDNDGFYAFVRSAYVALKEKGILMFDISSANKLNGMDGQVYFDDQKDASYIWQNTYDKNRSRLVMDITLFVSQGRLYERFEEQHIQYAHDEKVIKNLLHSAGFKNVDVLECFTDHEPNEHSQRLQFVCYK